AASVAAALALVGTAGYGVGAASGGGSSTGQLAADSGRSTEELAIEPGIAADAGAGANGAALDSRSSLVYPGGSGRNAFHASGLSTETGSAVAYGYDARSAATAENVAALAAALGMSGTPTLENGSWMLGSYDGTAPVLSVSLDGTTSFSYTDPALNPWCATVDASGVCTQEAAGDLPAEDTAIAAMRDVIAASGQDADAFEYTSTVYDGAVSRSVQAWPLLDGERLQQAWYLEYATGGVYSVNGSLAPLVGLGDYPIVSEQAAFERLSDPRFGASMSIMPADGPVALDMGVAEREAASSEIWTPPTEAPATPEAGSALSWAVNDVEIVSARLGLGSQWQSDGSVLVVPTYYFTDAAGAEWSMIAVADSQLDFAG
ncbi:hypothetical protein, partial [Agromyces seonyuensis]